MIIRADHHHNRLGTKQSNSGHKTTGGKQPIEGKKTPEDDLESRTDCDKINKGNLRRK